MKTVFVLRPTVESPFPPNLWRKEKKGLRASVIDKQQWLSHIQPHTLFPSFFSLFFWEGNTFNPDGILPKNEKPGSSTSFD